MRALAISRDTGIRTLHDATYDKVAHAIDKARAAIPEGATHADFYCPICGGPAFVVRPGANVGNTCVARCEISDCFSCWE